MMFTKLHLVFGGHPGGGHRLEDPAREDGVDAGFEGAGGDVGALANVPHEVVEGLPAAGVARRDFQVATSPGPLGSRAADRVR